MVGKKVGESQKDGLRRKLRWLIEVTRKEERENRGALN